MRCYLLGGRRGLLSAAFTARVVAAVRRHDELHRTARVRTQQRSREGLTANVPD